jgi:hypothetical protein
VEAWQAPDVTGRRPHIAGTHGGDSGSGGAVLGARVVRNILAETVEVTHLVLAGLDGELIEMLPTTELGCNVGQRMVTRPLLRAQG